MQDENNLVKQFIARKLISYPSKDLIGYALIDENRIENESLSTCCKELVELVQQIGNDTKELESYFNDVSCYLFSDYSKLEIWCAVNGYEHSRIRDKVIAEDLDYEEIDTMLDLYEQQFSE